jgi:hypothetical protein
MKPSQVIYKLRRIAADIENSKKPDRNLVARDLRQILAKIQYASSDEEEMFTARRDAQALLYGKSHTDKSGLATYADTHQDDADPAMLKDYAKKFDDIIEAAKKAGDNELSEAAESVVGWIDIHLPQWDDKSDDTIKLDMAAFHKAIDKLLMLKTQTYLY